MRKECCSYTLQPSKIPLHSTVFSLPAPPPRSKVNAPREASIQKPPQEAPITHPPDKHWWFFGILFHLHPCILPVYAGLE